MHGEEALKDFVEYLNLRVEPMNVTVEWSYDRVNLIDTTVIIKDGSLVSDLYSKPTDSHTYLLYNFHTPKGIRTTFLSANF